MAGDVHDASPAFAWVDNTVRAQVSVVVKVAVSGAVESPPTQTSNVAASVT
jgi:hypothetical protein